MSIVDKLIHHKMEQANEVDRLRAEMAQLITRETHCASKSALAFLQQLSEHRTALPQADALRIAAELIDYAAAKTVMELHVESMLKDQPRAQALVDKVTAMVRANVAVRSGKPSPIIAPPGHVVQR